MDPPAKACCGCGKCVGDVIWSLECILLSGNMFEFPLLFFFRFFAFVFRFGGVIVSAITFGEEFSCKPFTLSIGKLKVPCIFFLRFFFFRLLPLLRCFRSPVSSSLPVPDDLEELEIL